MASKGKPDNMTKEQWERYVAALRRERAGYVQDGQKDYVKAVDDELRNVGAEPGADGGDDKPKGRTAAKKSTASKPEADKAD
jgi:hypothetical protein